MLKVGTLNEIKVIADAPFICRLTIQGATVELELKKMSASNLESIKLEYPDTPPTRLKDNDGKMYIDHTDPEYLQKEMKVFLKRRAASVCYMLGHEFFGGIVTIEEKIVALKNVFSETDIERIFAAGAAAATPSMAEIADERDKMAPFVSTSQAGDQ